MKIIVGHIARSEFREFELRYGSPVDVVEEPALGDHLEVDGFPDGAEVHHITEHQGTTAVMVQPWDGDDDELDAHVASLRRQRWTFAGRFTTEKGRPEVGPRLFDGGEEGSGWYTDKLDLAWMAKRIADGWAKFDGDIQDYADHVIQELVGRDYGDDRPIHCKSVTVRTNETASVAVVKKTTEITYDAGLDVRFTVRGSDAARYSYSFYVGLFGGVFPVDCIGRASLRYGDPRGTPVEHWTTVPTCSHPVTKGPI